MYLTPRWNTVCPALLPPWLRTTISTFAVSTSIILPLPSSPHCAPIKIVLAIAIRNGQKNFPDASGRTQSGLPTNNMLANAGRNRFCVLRGSPALALRTSTQKSMRKSKREASDQGTGVCPLGEGEALGCSLPDSINVGRTAPLGSGFAVRELRR